MRSQKMRQAVMLSAAKHLLLFDHIADKQILRSRSE